MNRNGKTASGDYKPKQWYPTIAGRRSLRAGATGDEHPTAKFLSPDDVRTVGE